jgi:hypothetical protein
VSSNIDREREREERKREQAMPTATGCTSYRLHRLLSFSITNVFHLFFSLSLHFLFVSFFLSFLKKKTVFPTFLSFFFFLRFSSNSPFLSSIFCTTPLRLVFTHKHEPLLSTENMVLREISYSYQY